MNNLFLEERDKWMERGYPGLLTEWIGKDSLVFDIGANIGRMTYVYLSLGARVVAVEPQSVCVNEQLRPRLGNDDRVTIVHAAVGERNGETTITTYGHGSTISTLVPDHYWQKGGPWQGTPHDGAETVQMVTMDVLIRRFGVPDFAKIDVEGYEQQVLEGLSQFIPLSFEFHPFFREQACTCMERLMELEPRVEFNHTVGESLTYASPEWLGRAAMGNVLDALYKQHGRIYFGNIYARKAV